jgi:hypothetical protein
MTNQVKITDVGRTSGETKTAESLALQGIPP